VTTDPDRWDAAEKMDRAAGITDDECHGRCKDLREWFTWETRGLMVPEEAHQVLDMVLNRLASDRPELIELDRLRAQLAEWEATRTTGGPPRPYTHEWKNEKAVPVTIAHPAFADPEDQAR
jgi:hypothetical protein